MRLSVISVCSNRWSQRFWGKSSATPANTLRKCDLKLRMATSAAFRRWHPGGTNSMFILQVLQMWFFMFSKALLSSTCFLGVMPALFSRSNNALYARIISASLRLFIGSTKMALLSISTQDHYVFVAALQAHRELSCLVQKHSFADAIHCCVNVSHFFAMELQGVTCF